MSNTETTLKPIGPVRFSYLTVFKPRENPNKEDRPLEYSVVLMVPKKPNEFCDDPKGILSDLAAKIKAALSEKFPKEPPKWDNPLKDGDEEVDGQGNPKFPGYWFIRAWCKDEYPPLLVDCDKNPVTGGWQSGDWGKVLISFYGYDNRSKGVGVGLRGIQFLKHGEPLGGVSVSADAFAKEAGDAPLTTTEDDDWDPFADED